MKESKLSTFSLILSAIALFLLVATVVISTSNQSKQRELTARQPEIAAAQTINNLNQGLVRLMAGTAANTNDSQIRELLAANGITFSLKDQVPPAANAK